MIRVIRRIKKLKETVLFVEQKLDAAKWFIDAIKASVKTHYYAPWRLY